ncbi:MAG TPA: hypothetical protein PK876_07330, partial [Elusimicrobiota bacterium]|nr:hypothetical protein [Elusimicrobiota bacterium]
MSVRFLKTPFHLLSKTSICLFLLLFLSRGTLLARINLLEPWTQGMDASVPEKDWTHGGNLRL